MTPSIRIAQTHDEIAGCFAAMKHLRVDLQEDLFVSQVLEMMEEGYRLAFLEDADGRAVCVAGFRIARNLFLGRHLYVEDLSTLADARSAGHGTQMMDWLRQHAQAQGCRALHLDSGVQRVRAHKFYLNQNMQIACYHFLEKLGP